MSEMSRTSTRRAPFLAFAASLFTLLCTVQAAYWPIVNKPGTPISWWQNRLLAVIGYYLGLPALTLATIAPLGRSANIALLWVAALLWAILVYLLVAALARVIFEGREWRLLVPALVFA